MLVIKLLVILDKVKLPSKIPWVYWILSKSMFHCSHFSFVRGIACHFYFEKLHSLVLKFLFHTLLFIHFPRYSGHFIFLMYWLQAKMNLFGLVGHCGKPKKKNNKTLSAPACEVFRTILVHYSVNTDSVNIKEKGEGQFSACFHLHFKVRTKWSISTHITADPDWGNYVTVHWLVETLSLRCPLIHLAVLYYRPTASHANTKCHLITVLKPGY